MTEEHLFRAISDLIRVLLEPEEKNSLKRAAVLVQQHNELVSPEKRLDVLIYRDVPLSGTSTRGRRKTGSPHPSLEGELSLWHQQYMQLKQDRQKLQQALALICRKAENRQDLRDLLPELCIQFLGVLKDMPRMREEAYSIKGIPALEPKYQEMKDLIEYYAVTRLIS